MLLLVLVVAASTVGSIIVATAVYKSPIGYDSSVWADAMSEPLHRNCMKVSENEEQRSEIMGSLI